MPKQKARKRYGPVSLADVKMLRQILIEVVADFERVEQSMEAEEIEGILIDGVQTFGKAAQSLHNIIGNLQLGIAKHKADHDKARLDGVAAE